MPPSRFYWLERKFVIFAVFVKTPSFGHGTKARFTKGTVCATPRNWTLAPGKFGDQHDWTTGGPYDENEWRNARTPRVPFLMLIVTGLEAKGAFRLPGATWDRFRCTVAPSPGHIWCQKKPWPEMSPKVFSLGAKGTLISEPRLFTPATCDFPTRYREFQGRDTGNFKDAIQGISRKIKTLRKAIFPVSRGKITCRKG